MTRTGALLCLLAHAGTLAGLAIASGTPTARGAGSLGLVVVAVLAVRLLLGRTTPTDAARLGGRTLVWLSALVLVRDALVLTATTPAADTSFVWTAAVVPVVVVSAYATAPRGRARLTTLAVGVGWCVALGTGVRLAGVTAAEAELVPALVVVGVGALAGVVADVVAGAVRHATLRADRAVAAASLDPLTGLPNRRGARPALDDLVRRGGAVAIADLDHFKRVNDTHGHGVGDVVLTIAGARLAAGIREQDTPVRWGGEEFVVLLPHTSLADAAAVCERLRTSIALVRHPVPVTASFGVAALLPGGDLDEALARADDALYRAKATGRDRVTVDGVAGPLHVVGSPAPRPTGPTGHRRAGDPAPATIARTPA